MMCEISKGVESQLDGNIYIPKLEPQCIPGECQVLVFQDFGINNQSEIICDYGRKI